VPAARRLQSAAERGPQAALSSLIHPPQHPGSPACGPTCGVLNMTEAHNAPPLAISRLSVVTADRHPWNRHPWNCHPWNWHPWELHGFTCREVASRLRRSHLGFRGRISASEVASWLRRSHLGFRGRILASEVASWLQRSHLDIGGRISTSESHMMPKADDTCTCICVRTCMYAQSASCGREQTTRV